MKKLTDILSKVNVLWSSNIGSLEITDVEYDSREVKKGNLFFCVIGENDDGHLFIESALNNGAVCVVVSKDYYENALSGKNCDYQKTFERMKKQKVAIVVVENTVEAVSRISAFFYDYPSRSLNVVGVTGTNGKTSTTFMIESIINNAGMSAGVIGTILYRYAGKEIHDGGYTTPKSLTLQRIMSDMVASKVTHVAMEVSSHGIELGRVWDIDFDVAIFTQLSREHMEFHKDMDDYFHAKKKLFTDILAKSSKKNKTAIINIDCPYGRKLIEFVSLLKDVKLYTYGFSEEADLRVEEHEFNTNGSTFKIRDGKNLYDFELPLIGKHNIYNALSAIAVTLKVYGIDHKIIRSALSESLVIHGRLERVAKGYNVFVDYAHTDDALTNVLSALRNTFPEKRIITVFGCGGDRDKGKRPKMGKVVSDLSDYAIVTSDNPRHEDPVKIVESIAAGMRPNIYEIILDRRDAIKKAMSMMDKQKDVILIAGKGHEAYQLINGEKHDFDDRIVAREFLNGGIHGS